MKPHNFSIHVGLVVIIFFSQSNIHNQFDIFTPPVLEILVPLIYGLPQSEQQQFLSEDELILNT